MGRSWHRDKKILIFQNFQFGTETRRDLRECREGFKTPKIFHILFLGFENSVNVVIELGCLPINWVETIF